MLLLTCLSASVSVADSDGWLVTLRLKTFEHYLDFPGSSISSITKVSVSFAQPNNGPAKLYENLYYAHNHAIGCARLSPLSINPGTAGVIRLTTVNEEQSSAAANAIARIYLDLYVRKCPLTAVEVPLARFRSVISGLYTQGFHTAVLNSPDSSGHCLILVESEPPGMEEYLVM